MTFGFSRGTLLHGVSSQEKYNMITKPITSEWKSSHSYESFSKVSFIHPTIHPFIHSFIHSFIPLTGLFHSLYYLKSQSSY